MGMDSIRQLVDDKVGAAALGDLSDTAARDRAIAQALLRYSEDAPRELAELATVIPQDIVPLPAGWVDGRSRLLAVEFPLDEVPRTELEAAYVYDGTAWRILLADPRPGDQVRVHYSAPHTLTASTSTIPAWHENALACWAAAELCRQLATRKGHDRESTIGAAQQAGASASGDLARRAKDWERDYRLALGLPDPDRVSGPAAAGAVATWSRDRRRARYFTVPQG